MQPEHSNSPQATGHPASSTNDAGALIAGVPVWWHPAKLPAQVAKTRDEILATIGTGSATDEPSTGALLYGPPGTGKTSAACAILYAWAKAGHSSRFQDFSELMVRIRSSWRKDAATTTEQIQAEMMKPRILLLDDVGKRAAAEDQETLSTLVNGRLNRGRLTILTTNCDLATAEGRAEFLAAADSRVLERYRRCDIRVAGTNLRK